MKTVKPHTVDQSASAQERRLRGQRGWQAAQVRQISRRTCRTALAQLPLFRRVVRANEVQIASQAESRKTQAFERGGSAHSRRTVRGRREAARVASGRAPSQRRRDLARAAENRPMRQNRRASALERLWFAASAALSATARGTAEGSRGSGMYDRAPMTSFRGAEISTIGDRINSASVSQLNQGRVNRYFRNN
jgi:hypothetical protein